MGEGVPIGGLGQSPLRSPEPVGRSPECSVIREVLDHARSGTGEFLCLEGEAGIGKTALLSWVTTEATGFRVLRARPSPDFDGTAYSAVAELLVSAARTRSAVQSCERDRSPSSARR